MVATADTALGLVGDVVVRTVQVDRLAAAWGDALAVGSIAALGGAPVAVAVGAAAVAQILAEVAAEDLPQDFEQQFELEEEVDLKQLAPASEAATAAAANQGAETVAL